MEIYFLRHGETPWNRERRIQGSTGWIDLTEEGARLAGAVRDGMLRRGVSFDRVFSSPYRRALHTAEIICSGYGIKPVTDERLCEMSFGPYEGTRYGEGLFVDANVGACFLDPPRYVARDGAESFEAVAARLRGFVDEVLSPLCETCSRVLVVTHGGILRTALCLAGRLSLEGFWKGRQPNCCVHAMSLSGGVLGLKKQALMFADPLLSNL